MRNNNTRNLWDAIKKMGNFLDSYYDKNIELDMKNELGLKKNESLQELQPEIVFSTFFKVMSPLSIMYEDILYLFNCCKANKSSQNIEIVFQSSEFLSAKFNIQHFIEAKSKLKNVKIYAKKISIDAKKIMNIWSLKSENNIRENEVIKNELFRKWADEYWINKNKWPEVTLKFEEIAKNLPISDLLLRSFECWEELFAFYKLTDRMNWHNWLVDYGEINQERIITAVKNVSRRRYDIFSKCRPQNENVAKFSETIRKFLYQYSDIFEANTKYSMRFILSWDGISKAQDLDLYMNFIGDDKIRELSYRSQDINGSKYSGDVQKSPGEEWIKVENWYQGVYDVWVNNYSEDINFADGNPVVIVEEENIGRVIELKLEKSYSNKLNWWHILKIDTRLNIGYVINKMEDQMKI